MKDKMKVKWLFFPVVVLLMIGLMDATFAAAQVTQTPIKAKPEGTLVIAMSTFHEEGFLPYLGSGAQAPLWEIMYDYLLFTNMKTRDPIPGLATKWEYSNNYQDLTIWLRKGVSWHDGWGEVTAEDVKYTYERIMGEGATSSATPYFRQNIKNIEVVDPYKLVVHLKKTDPSFWIYMTITADAWVPVVCKKYIEKVGDKEANLHPIGSGPYRLVEHKFGDYLKFEALDTHWRIVPEFKHLTMRIVPEETTAIAMLKTGEIDIAPISAPKIPELQKAGLKISDWPGSYAVDLCFGGIFIKADKRYVEGYHNKDPWVDLRVREAMNIAIDRNAIVKTLYRGAAKPATIGIMCPGWDELKPYPYDPQRAKKLLAEAGFPKGFSLSMASYGQVPGEEMPQVIEAIAGYWDAIGIKAKIVPGTSAGFRTTTAGAKTSGWIWPWRVGYIDDWTLRALNYYYPMSTYSFFQSPELTALIDKVLAEADYKKAKAIWGQIAAYLHDNYVNVTPVIASKIWATNQKVGEWPINPAARPYNLVYIRHAKPVKTYRLFEIQ